jgi:ribosomal protein S18 acetylase RimI-like enzyme
MTIHPAAADDWARVGALAEVLVRTHYAFDRRRFVPPETLRAPDYIVRLREEVDGGDAVVLVAEAGGAIAGYVFAGVEAASWKDLRGEAGYVHDLVVDERHRRGGIGRALVEQAIAWFSARGISRVMLSTAPSNAGAQRLFRAMGFRDSMIEMTLWRGDV